MPLDAFYLNYSTSLKFGQCNHLPVVLTFYSFIVQNSNFKKTICHWFLILRLLVLMLLPTIKVA